MTGGSAAGALGSTTPPWTPERVVDAALARALIEDQHPELAPARVETFAEGWDNALFLVNDEWVFRFPQREVGVPLMETEVSLLPALAPHLPLQIPVPERVGKPAQGYPWPFAGYRILAGAPAHIARPDDAARARAAAPLARFLRALHDFSPQVAREHGAFGDTHARLDLARRCEQIALRLEEAQARGLIEDARRWHPLLSSAPPGWSPMRDVLVHGDLGARHLLLDESGNPTGVVDWGDAHLGDPAQDLAIAQTFLPQAARQEFREAYGEIDPASWAAARIRAAFVELALLIYADAQQDRDLLDEARRGLESLLED